MTKRYLLSAAIFFAAGTVINVLEISLFLILAEGLFVTVFILLFRRKYAVLCVVMLFFLALGIVRMELAEQKRLATVNRYHGTTKYLEMVATDFSDEEKVIVKFSDGKNSGKAYLSLDEGTELCPGQVISGRVKLTEPPWDSPGKNTGVGCHFLLQCMKLKSESEVAQSCLTPSDPMDCSLPGSCVQGIFQARILEWVAISFSRGYCWPREQSPVSSVSCISGRFFTH